jgi:hypothetical protein
MSKELDEYEPTFSRGKKNETRFEKERLFL